MSATDARRILGVEPGSDLDELRVSYRKLLLRTHPDLSGEGDATERTIELTRAYTLLVDEQAAAEVADTPPAPRATGAESKGGPAADQAAPQRRSEQRREQREPIVIELVDSDTIGVGAPADETLFLLLDAANRLGEITYLDPSAGLIELIVEFVEAPTSSVVLSMQGRATGTTEVFCTVEPLSGGEAPPSDAVTRLILGTLREVVGG